MKKLHVKQFTTENQKGFTLVELAIVMTIIGLLIGGVLKGQQLLENARMTATIAQIKGYESAAISFRDTYGSLPGDLRAAEDRLPNCALPSGSASPTNTCNSQTGVEDGRVGSGIWEYNSVVASSIRSGQGDNIRFFGHLLKADLITGVTDDAAYGRIDANPVFTQAIPEARIGGGFIIGFVANNAVINSAAPLSGHVLSIVAAPAAAALITNATTAQTNIRADRAAQIDRKLDDGNPTTGFVQAPAGAAGPATGCVDTAATPPLYLEANTNRTCSVVMRILG